MNTQPPQPGQTWQHPYGRMFKVLQRDVMAENGLGHRWGPLVHLQAMDDNSVVIALHQNEVDAPAQREMLI